MNGVRADLIQAIIAAPDDDAPRLVLADWLEENGSEDQAEFIRVQIALANPPACQKMESLLKRSEELSNIVFCRLPVFNCDRWECVRGCVESVTCSWDCWREHYAAILETNPIRTVTLTSIPDWDYVDSDMMLIEFMGVIYDINEIGMGDGEHIPAFMLRIVWPKIRFNLLQWW